MSLVTVTSPGHPEKIFLMGNSLEQLLQSAIGAFKLPQDETYEIRRESDGVKIISDDVLRFLSTSAERDGHLAVNISAAIPNSDRETTPNLNRGILITSPPRIPLSVNRPEVVRPALPMRNIVDALDPVLSIVLDPSASNITPGRFLKLRKVAVKETYQEIAKFIRGRVKCFSYATARHYAQLVFGYEGGKYSKLFEVKVGSKVKSGLSSFTQQLYNHLNYRKEESEKRPRGARRCLQMEEDVDDPLPLIPADMHCAAYGCVRYEEALPTDECEASQEEKRLRLLALDPDLAESEVLMESTYVSQRVSINRAVPLKKRLPEVLGQWPLLKHRKHLCQHASRLLGKDVLTEWSSSLGDKCGRFNDFMLTHWTSEDRKKSSATSKRMLDLLKQKEEALAVLTSNESNCLTLFPLLVGFMKDQEALLFQVKPAEMSDTEVSRSINTDNPVLVIRGESLFELDATAHVFVTGVGIPAASVIDGFLLVILAYFVFGFKYPPKIASSLEFMQRQLLDINPERGSKRSGRKGQEGGVAAKVRTLTELLTYHCSAWNVCRF